MLNKKSLKIIKGGKENTIKQSFEGAVATRTRLMGVIALKIHWVREDKLNYFQWFLFDSEEHGIYDYEDMLTNNVIKSAEITQRFMGHLGGEIVNINEEEAMYLIQYYGYQNLIHKKDLPSFYSYSFTLKKEVQLSSEKLDILNKKIYEEISSYIELIHYFIMRKVGNDIDGAEYLLSKDTINYDYKPTEGAAVLLKNEIRILESDGINSTYICKSVVDRNEDYKIIHSKILINEEELSIVNAEVIEIITVSPEEVAYEIKNTEYIKTYELQQHSEKLIASLEHLNKNALQYNFKQGKMYVEFRKNNQHVKRKTFYIGGDILAIYFLNHFNQFIVCYYDEGDYAIIEKSLMTIPVRKILKELRGIKLKGSIIYEYAEAKETDFCQYINRVIKDID
ncbi:hypothetical protein F8154_02920 [Alkaliphilus pronyensis]|uniref:Uncharacterized protein n=1 Tax=Alkaliphilus pronyensis TaxID=1482732 RepID=A0A6I0FA28_9FIRM|nr:hypothetical protein [Alkaliphilus pronyensis]KAB3537262.1 hypothetical protein F8154_02920 [Alkaliphilus pronyensis]